MPKMLHRIILSMLSGLNTTPWYISSIQNCIIENDSWSLKRVDQVERDQGVIRSVSDAQ